MSQRSLTKWDQRFMDEAQLVATWSKDPRTKCGAVIVDGLNRQQGQGFNGFPRGVKDLDERYATPETKYAMIVHAEANAIVTARKDLSNCRLYATKFPCTGCTKLIIQAGIIEVICPWQDPNDESVKRWAADAEYSRTMLREADVEIFEIGAPTVEVVAKDLSCAICGWSDADVRHHEGTPFFTHNFQAR